MLQWMSMTMMRRQLIMPRLFILIPSSQMKLRLYHDLYMITAIYPHMYLTWEPKLGNFSVGIGSTSTAYRLSSSSNIFEPACCTHWKLQIRNQYWCSSLITNYLYSITWIPTQDMAHKSQTLPGRKTLNQTTQELDRKRVVLPNNDLSS